MNTPPRSRFLAPAAITLAVLSLAGLAVAGPEKTEPAAKPTAKPDRQVQGAAGAVALSDLPFHLESVGLTVRLPVDSNAETTKIGGRTNVSVVPNDGSWMINIQTPQTTKQETTIENALESTLKLIEGSYGVVDPDQQFVLETQAKVLEKTTSLKLPGGPAARMYVSLPPAVAGKARLTKGYTIFKPSPTQFVVFELVCSEKDFGSLRAIYENVVGTAVFANNDALAKERGEAVGLGTEFIKSLSESDYLEAMGQGEQWHRLSIPSEGGSQMDVKELGYRGVRFWRGARGEINPNATKANWSKAEQQEGYLVQVRGRILIEGGVGDTLGTYFMSLDRNEEFWTVSTTFKNAEGKQLAQGTETGARVGNDMTVVKDETGKAAQTIKPPILGPGYISQFETYLLPRLLARKKAEGTLGWYAYASNPSPAVAFRKDEVAKEGSLWRVVTTQRPDTPAQTSYFGDGGDFVSTQLNDRRVWEPIDLTTLKRIWQTKGLPVDR